jgi:hypothetical protein
MPPTKRDDGLPTPEARDAFIQQLQETPWLASIIAQLEKKRFSVDQSIISELREIAAYHGTLFAKGLPRLPIVRTHTDLIRLQEENAICLAHRDRVTEIIVSYLAVEQALDELWDKAEERLQAYPAYKAQSNERARELFVLAVLQPIYGKRTHIKQVLRMSEEISKSLTHTHFTIKQQAEMGIAVLNQRSS